jgi:hypothetical protein
LRGWVFIVIGEDKELGQLRCLMKKLQPIAKSFARHEYERLDLLRMAARRVDGVEDAEPTCSSHPNQLVIDARLRAQVLECDVNIVRPARAGT